MRRAILAAAVATSLATASTAAAATITDLGAFTGGTASRGTAVAANGTAVGIGRLPDGTYHAASFPPDAFLTFDLGTDRATPAYSYALAISPNGTYIVGWTEPTYPAVPADVHQNYRAAWFSGGRVIDLGSIQQTRGGAGGNGCRTPDANGYAGVTASSYAVAVNDAGVVIGLSDYSLHNCWAPYDVPDNTLPLAHAFRFRAGDALPENETGGSMEDLGTFNDVAGGPGGDCAFSGALAVDSAGAIVGDAGRSDWGGFGTTSAGGCSGLLNISSSLIAHAFLIPAGGAKGDMIDLGQPGTGTGDNNYSEAVAINEHGLIAVNGTMADGHMEAYIYDRATSSYRGNGLGPVALGTLGTALDGATADAMNNAGEIVGSSGGKPFLWVAGTMVDLNSLIPRSSGWTLLTARAINDAGDIVGTGSHNGVERAYILHQCLVTRSELSDPAAIHAMPDADGDGIPDCWEGPGGVTILDASGTAVATFTLPESSPKHKDLYVEVDAMPGYGPVPGALEDVEAAFARAPITNPDGNAGIALHAIPDPEPIPYIQHLAFDAGSIANFWDLVKNAASPGSTCPGHFGAVAERADPNCQVLLEAKAAIYRYALFADQQETGNESSGRAEPGGNDLVITLGGLSASDLTAIVGGLRGAQAGTFMHELGHTLGLYHGGGDRGQPNCKPNYLSVMNYSYQFQYSTLNRLRPLDYSREALPSLNENDLSEPAGIGGPPLWQVVWGLNRSEEVGFADAPVDWNRRLPTATELHVAATITETSDTVCQGQPRTTLTGFDDWAAIQLLPFRLDGAGNGGAVPQEVTTTEIAAIATNPANPYRPAISAARTTVRALKTKGLRITVASGDPAVTTITLSVPPRTLGRKGTAAVVIGTLKLTTRDHRPTTATLKLAARLARLLKRAGTITFTLKATMAYPRLSQSVSRTVKLTW